MVKDPETRCGHRGEVTAKEVCRKACGFPGGVDRPTFEVESEAPTYNTDPSLRGFGGLDAAAVTSLAVGAPASDSPPSAHRDGVFEVPSPPVRGVTKPRTGQRSGKDEEAGQVGAAVLRLGRGGPRASLRRAGHGRGRGRVPRGVLRAGAQEFEKGDVEREAAAPGALIDPFPPVPRGPC